MAQPPVKKFLAFAAFIAVLASFSSLSYAEPSKKYFKPSPWTKEKLYMDKFSHKAGFGVLNMGTGWMAILFEPYHEGWKGLLTGPFYAVTNTAGGMIQLVTSPIPVDQPLPHGGIAYEYEDRS